MSPQTPPPQAQASDPSHDAQISWDDAAQWLESDEYKKLPKDRQDAAVAWLKTHAKAQPPPVEEIAGNIGEGVARRHVERMSGLAKMFAEPETVPGVAGGAIHSVGSMLAGPAQLAEAVSQDPKRALTAGKEFFAQPVREAFHVPQPGEDPAVYQRQKAGVVGGLEMSLLTLLGGDPAAARARMDRGDASGAYAEMLTAPLLTAGLGRLLKIPEKDVASTRREVSALQNISRGAVRGAGPADAAARVAEVQSLIKQTLAKEGVTDARLKKTFPIRDKAPQKDIVGDVARGNQRALDIAKKTVQLAHEPIDAVVKRFASRDAGPIPQQVAGELRAQAAEFAKGGNQPLAAACNQVADAIEKSKSFGDLNSIKSTYNKMLDAVYSSTPGKAIDATAERAYAYKLAADGIREKMYPELQRLSGGNIDLAKMGRREADTIAMRDGVFEHYYSQVAPEQAGKESHGFIEYSLAGRGAPGHSFYSKHILGRAAEKQGVVPTGGAEFNRQFRRGAGPVGRGIQPEKTISTELPPHPGASYADLMAQRAHQLGIDERHPMSEPQFRQAFNISPRTQMRDLRAALIAEEVSPGQWRIGPRVQKRLRPIIGTTPYKPGTVTRFPRAGKATKAGARSGRAAAGTVQSLTPPPQPTDEEPEE